jgi:glycerol kinase
MTSILVIDQSTSATKAVLFSSEGTVLDRAARDHRQIYPQPGWVEHDADEIWQSVLAVIREVAERNRANLPALAGLSITNQRETIVVFDRKTGKPLHNAIVWQCRRGEPICRQLREQGHEERVAVKTGLKIDTYFSASKLKWLVNEKPNLAAQLRGGSALIGTIETYLIYRLTEGKVFATDQTNASRTLLFDIRKLRWDEELCSLFDVPIAALAEPRDSAATFGETDASGALPCRLPICGVMGDSQASLFAQRCFEPGMVKATFGTGTSVLVNIGSQPRRAGNGAVLALAWVWQGKPVYAFEGIINCSAATITWLRDQLGLLQSSQETETLARKAEDNGGVYLVPAFAGLGAPWWAPDARAAIVGMTAFTRREHIVRAADEAIGYQLRDVLDLMRAQTPVPLSNLHADGGPTRDTFLMQFVADLTGLEIMVAEVPEASAWGAAMSGLLGLENQKFLESAPPSSRSPRTFRPQMAAEEVSKLYNGWLAAVKRVL